jgi:hypothetical protein
VTLQRQRGLKLFCKWHIIPPDIENIEVLIKKNISPPKTDHGAQRAIGI